MAEFRFFLSLVGVLFFFAGNAVADSAPRIALPLRVDLMRQNESGETHFAIRCSKGINADNSPKCEIRKYFQKNLIASAAVTLTNAKEIVDGFFSDVPKKEISHAKKSVRRVATESPLTWSISDGSRTSDGGVIAHGSAAQESAQRPVTSAILALEVDLESYLIHR